MSRAPDSLWKAARSAYGALMALPAARRAKGVVVRRLDRSDWTAWAKLSTGDRLRVDLANKVGRTILVRGSYDRDLVEFVIDPLRPGSVFVDVGANVGYFAALAAERVGREGLVVAIEPSPTVVSLLASSIATNGWSNVVLLSVAATAEPALLRFCTEADSALGHVDESGDQLVPGLPLDLAVGPLVAPRHVASIKIDVEGHELEAIDGMWKLLHEHRPERILAEAHPHYGRPWLDRLFGRLRSLGYDAVDPKTLSPITPAQVSTSLWNVGFVQPQA